MSSKRSLPSASLRGHYAGFITRYLAFLIDVLLVALASFLLVTIIRVTLSFFGFRDLAPATTSAGAPATITGLSPGAMTLLRWLLTVLGSFLGFGIYSIIAWLLVGKTAGKALMGLRGLGHDGRRLSVRQAVVRALGYYVSGLPLFLGFLWVLGDDRRQAWHDKLAGTFVVYEWDARNEERYVVAVNKWRAAHRQRRQEHDDAAQTVIEGDAEARTNDG